MEQIEHQIEEAFIRFGKKFTRGSIIMEGFIKEVDETNYTCSVNIPTKNDDGTFSDCLYSNVPLKILKGSKAGILEIPTIGTNCLMAFRDNNIQRPQLIYVNQIDKFYITIGEITLQASSEGFIFNGGNDGGMPKSSEIGKIIDTMTSILGVIKGSPINEPGNGSPSALQNALKVAIANNVMPDITSLQNKTIKQ